MKKLLCSIITLLLFASATEVKAISTVSANFTGTPIAAGNKIWFTAAVKITGTATYPLTIYFTGQGITSPAFSLSVPNAILILDPAVTTATTVFNGTTWVTTCRPNEPGYYFLSGYSHTLTAPLPGSLSPVTWTGNFTASRSGVSILWHMAAAVYTTFNTNLNALGVKPSDCSSCSSYLNSHSSGAPENYLAYVISGARGGGGGNYTGGFSGAGSVSPGLAGCNTHVCVGGAVALNPGSPCTSWSSSNTSVATVDGSGVVTGVAAGTSRISYAITGCSIMQTATVTVNASPTISASATSSTMCAGATLTLNATTSASGGCSGDAAISWHGPAGFTSSSLHPTRTAMTTEMAGVYSVTVTDHGCSGTATTAVAVNKLPTAVAASITPIPLCAGNTIHLNGTVTGGSGYTLLWTGGASTINNNTTTAATITSATTADAGTYSLTATAAGCPGSTRGTAALTTVHKLPTTLTASVNPNPVCQGGAVALRATSSGGAGTINYVWTGPSGGSTIVNPASITTAGVTATVANDAGVYTVTASAEGCGTMTASTGALVVNKLPTLTAVVNPTNICIGGTFSLTGTVTGGSGYSLLWTGGTSTIDNNTTANATVTSATLTDAGSYTLTATAPACGSTSANTSSLVVSAGPSSSGPTNNGPVCAGGTVILSANSSSATAWSWTGPGGFTSSLQNPTITPTATGTYSLMVSNTTTGCNPPTVYTTTVTVGSSSTIGVSSGATICAGASTTLTASGGTSYSWAPSTGLSATAGATVTASPSSTTTYTVTGITSGSCSNSATVTVSVNALPVIDAGAGIAICEGSSTILTATGGTTYSWVPTTGLVPATGASVTAGPGSSTIYTVTATANGCSNTATVAVSVNPLPDAGTITGPGIVCVGSTMALSGSASGGSWSSGSPTIATVSSMGVVTGITTGTAIISYTSTTTCGAATATKTVTVSAASVGLTGPSDVNVGANILLSLTGGTWSSSNTTIATVDATGTVTGINGGTATISYTMSNSCFSFTATKDIAVNAVAIAPITGTMAMCVGNTTALSDATAGGTWSSGNTAVATVSSMGIVTGVSAGTAIISYSLLTSVVTAVVTINELPAAITGTLSLCAGMTTTLSDATEGGTWSITPTTIATIGSSSGIVTAGSTAGTASVTYTLSTGCVTIATLTVNGLPAAIGGTKAVCVGATTTLTETSGGGTWSSGNGSVATIGATTGIVTGVAAGTASISYTLGTGCIGATTVTVNAIPDITGALIICQGTTTTLSSGTGGTWSSSNTGVATVGSTTGIVTGVAGGTARITYTSGNSCSANVVMTVNAILPISGNPLICVGTTTTLTDGTSGGTWSSADASIASVVSITGVVTGVSVGTTTISYTLGNGCFRTMSVNVTTLTPISGTTQVCVGLTTTLANATSGGAWSSANNAIASVGTSGIVTGVAAGTTFITYTAGSCRATTVMTVLASPAVISGPSQVCEGATITLGDATAGGTWSTTGTNITISGTATTSLTVTGVTAGATTVTYSAGSVGCYRLHTINVNALPAPISGTLTVCPSGTTTLADATVGGTWTSSNTSIATVGVTSGLVGGVVTGNALITYKLSTSCLITTTVTVISSPSPILGPQNVCTGSAIVLSDTSGSGTWASSNGGLAVVGSTTGIVTGVAAGVPTITFTLAATGCKAKISVTVTAIPNAGTLVGPTVVATGSTITLTTTGTPGGEWSSSNANATVSSTGVVTGVSAGLVTITYAVTNACGYSGAYKTISVAAARAASGGSDPAINGRSSAASISNTGENTSMGMPAGGNKPSASSIKAVKGGSIKNNTHGAINNKGRGAGNAAALSWNSASNEVSILPNPNKGGFEIRGTLGAINDEEAFVEIRSTMGQLIYRTRIVPQNGVIDEHVQLNSNLPTGIYILSVKTRTKNKVLSFVIEH